LAGAFRRGWVLLSVPQLQLEQPAGDTVCYGQGIFSLHITSFFCFGHQRHNLPHEMLVLVYQTDWSSCGMTSRLASTAGSIMRGAVEHRMLLLFQLALGRALGS
jgi:hypothetical protein